MSLVKQLQTEAKGLIAT